MSRRFHLRRVTFATSTRYQRPSLTVLHYDDDYDRISEVTHQATEWVAPRGSLDR